MPLTKNQAMALYALLTMDSEIRRNLVHFSRLAYCSEDEFIATIKCLLEGDGISTASMNFGDSSAGAGDADDFDGLFDSGFPGKPDFGDPLEIMSCFTALVGKYSGGPCPRARTQPPTGDSDQKVIWDAINNASFQPPNPSGGVAIRCSPHGLKTKASDR